MEKEIKIFLKVVGIIFLLYLAWLLKEIILLFLLSWILATLFRPGVNWLEKKKIPRPFGGAIILGGFLIILILLFAFLLPPLIFDIQSFFSRFPSYFSSIWEKLPELEKRFYGIPFKENLEKTIFEGINFLSQKIFQFGLGIFRSLFGIFFVLVATFYLSIEKHYPMVFFQNFPYLTKKEKIYQFISLLEGKLRSWISCYLGSAVYIGFLSFLFLNFFKSKYSLLLGSLAALLEIIPIIGPICAGLSIFLIVLLEKNLTVAILALTLYAIFEQIGNYFLMPFLIKKKLKVNPLLAILALACGAKIGGILGMVTLLPILMGLFGVVEEKRSSS